MICSEYETCPDIQEQVWLFFVYVNVTFLYSLHFLINSDIWFKYFLNRNCKGLSTWKIMPLHSHLLWIGIRFVVLGFGRGDSKHFRFFESWDEGKRAKNSSARQTRVWEEFHCLTAVFHNSFIGNLLEEVHQWDLSYPPVVQSKQAFPFFAKVTDLK